MLNSVIISSCLSLFSEVTSVIHCEEKTGLTHYSLPISLQKQKGLSDGQELLAKVTSDHQSSFVNAEISGCAMFPAPRPWQVSTGWKALSLVQLKESLMQEVSFSFSKQYRHDLGDWTTNWQLSIYGLLFCFESCLSCSACTEARREKPRDWLFHREVLWNVPQPCLCCVPLRFSLSVLTWIEHLEDNPASGSCSLYHSSYVSSACLFKVLEWKIMSQDQRRGGQREKVALCFESLSLYYSCTLLVSSGDARHSGGDVPWHPPAGRPDEGNQRPGRVRGPVHRDAPRHWGHLAHALQLPVLLVGAGARAPAPQCRALVHQGHVWTPQCHPGQHSENHQQQPGHRRGLLDEAHCRYHACLSALASRCLDSFSSLSLSLSYPRSPP